MGDESGLSWCPEMPEFSSSVPAVCSLDLSVFWIAKSQDSKLYHNGGVFREKQCL